jgi:HAD superfamily hydrolase (TIGR01509 family)
MKGIIFDFNGTMVWDVNYQEIAWKNYFNKVTGKIITNKELEEKFYGVPMRISLKKHLFKDSNNEEVDKYAKEKEEIYRNAIIKEPSEFILAPGLEQLLDELKERQIPMTIATASIKDNVDFFIKQLRFEKWFDITKIVYDTGEYTDKKDMFLKAANNINKDISDVIIFEDSTAGIADAKNAGCKEIVIVNLGKNDNKYSETTCSQLIINYTEFNRNII